MSLAEEYRRQFAWRDWPRVFEELPQLAGRLVFDLGCGVGDLSAELVRRGARVVGFDGNPALLAEARGRALDGAEFHEADLGNLTDVGEQADGLWCSFVAAYFPDLAPILELWSRRLKPGGWAVLTEIDDLFSHEPLAERTRSLLEAYVEAARQYDFRMGRKLEAQLTRAGLRVTRTLTLADREFSESGPVEPAVQEAWGARFQRMSNLRRFCGGEFEAVRDDFLAGLVHPEHRTTARVLCCLAFRDS